MTKIAQNITIQNNDSFRIGNIVAINIRIVADSAVNANTYLLNVPTPANNGGRADGDAIVAVTNNRGIITTISADGKIYTGTQITQNTTVCFTAIYLAKSS